MANHKLGFPKPLFLSLLGFCGIAGTLIYFRDGIFFKDNLINFEENIVYKLILLAFLGISIILVIHLLIVTFRIKLLSRKISKYNNPATSIKDLMNKKTGVFRNIWDLYSETLIFVKPNTEKTRADADLYFNAEDIVNKTFLGFPAMELLKIIPGTFIGLGILGTFIGFTNAIPNSSTFTSIDDLKPLLEGLKVAFNTSIFGVLGSIFYNFLITQPLVLSLDKNARELSDLFDGVFYISDAEISQLALIRMDEIIKEGRDEFATKVKVTTETLERVSEVLKQTPQMLTETNCQLKESVENICEKTKEQLNLTVDTIRSTLTEELTKVNKSFNESAEIIKSSCDSISKVPGEVVDLRDKLEGVINQTSEYLQNCYVTVEEYITKSLDTLLNDVNSKCEENLNNVSNDIKEMLKTSLETTQSQLKETIVNLENETKNNVDKLVTKINDIITVESDKITSNVTILMNELVTQNNNFIKSETESIHNYVTSFEETMNAISKETESMPEEINQIYENLHKIPEELKQLQDEFIESSNGVLDSSTLAQSVSKIKDLNESLIGQETVLVSLMNNSGEKFTNAVVSVEKVSDGLDKILTKMEKAEDRIQASNIAMDLSINKLLKHKTTEEVLKLLNEILNAVNNKSLKDSEVDEQ